MKALLFITLLLSTSTSYALNKAEYHVSKMLDKYTSLTAYEDTGKTKIIATRKDGEINIENKTFTTFYTEKSKLKFQWTALPTEIDKTLSSLSNTTEYLKPKKYIVWKDNTGIYTKYKNKEKRQHNNIATALSSATGISDGLAWLVPRFLSPEIACAPNLNASKSEIINENDTTITIKQHLPSGTLRILHINRNTYFLHKYESISEISSGTKYHQISVYNVSNYK